MPPRPKAQTAALPGSCHVVSSVHLRANGAARVQRFSNTCQRKLRPGAGFDKHIPNAERGEQRAEERAAMSQFFNFGVGSKLRQPLPNSTNYLNAYNRSGQLMRVVRDRRAANDGDEGSSTGTTRDNALQSEEDHRPFPLNKQFLSQPVLSEELRTELWAQVQEKKRPLKAVSAEFGVAVERVAAVVRMKEMERDWLDAGIPLARPYSKAVMSMLPQTPLRRDARLRPVHESINDVYVHPSTRAQVFYPVSESRQFNREDAGRAFDRTLLPTEKRIPHPEMVQGEQWMQQGLPASQVATKMQSLLEKDAARRRQREQKRREKEARELKVVGGERWDFRFRDFDATKVGKDGRASQAVGYRYGAPHEDRKKGQIKIPTKVLG